MVCMIANCKMTVVVQHQSHPHSQCAYNIHQCCACDTAASTEILTDFMVVIR